MKRANRISAVALALYGLAFVLGLFGASGVSKALVAGAALVFLVAGVLYVVSGLRFLVAVATGRAVINVDSGSKRAVNSRSRAGIPKWQSDFVSMQTGVPNDIRVTAVDGTQRKH